jgi:hypothetical protein
MRVWSGLVLRALTAFFALLASAPAAAQADAASPPADAASDLELAKKLANPVSSLISAPFQSNWDCCYGPQQGGRYTLNIQPVVPLTINADWTLIVRTIMPVIDQRESVAGEGRPPWSWRVHPELLLRAADASRLHVRARPGVPVAGGRWTLLGGQMGGRSDVRGPPTAGAMDLWTSGQPSVELRRRLEPRSGQRDLPAALHQLQFFPTRPACR